MYLVCRWAKQAVERKKPISNDKTRFGPKDPCLPPTDWRKVHEVPRWRSPEEWKLIPTSQGGCDDLLGQRVLRCLPSHPGHRKVSKESIVPEVRQVRKQCGAGELEELAVKDRTGEELVEELTFKLALKQREER